MRDYAPENGIPLGLDTLEEDPDDKSDVSQLTKDRTVRQTTRQVLTQVTDLIFPLVDFSRTDNATYDTETYLDAECLIGLNTLAAEQGREIYADNVVELARQEMKTDVAPAEDKRTDDKDDAHVRTIQLLDCGDIRDLVHEGIDVLVNTAARHPTLFE